MSKLAVNSILLIVGKILSGFSSIAGGVVLARWLTIEEYGTYSQLILIASSLLIFSNLSLPRGLYYFIPRAENVEQKKSVAIQLLGFTFISSIIFGGIVYLLSPTLAQWMHNEHIANSGIYISTYLVSLSVASAFEPLLISLDKAKLVSAVEPLSGIASFFAIVIPIYFGIDFRCILIGLSIILLAKIFIQFYVIFQLKARVRMKQCFRGIIGRIKYSLPLAIDSMIGIIGRRLDQIMISSIFTPSQYALYARGAFELPLVATIPMTIFNLMLPDFTRDIQAGRTERVIWQFSDKTRRVALLFFPLTVIMFLLSEVFIIFLFSEKYADSVPVFQIYLLLLPARISMAGSILKAAGKTKYFVISNAIAVLSNLLISLVLIKWIGMTGAAWGTVISVYIILIYISALNCKTLHTSLNKLFPLKDLGRIMIVSLIAGGFIFPIISLIDSNALKMMVGTSIFVFFYVVLGYFFKIFHDRDILLIKKGILAIYNKII